MKQKINLYSVYCAYSSLNKDLFNSYLKFHDTIIKENEIDDLINLVKALLKPRLAKYRAFEYFSFGFTIPQIGKEFDLLRFGKESIINIELKNNSTQEKIKNQLIKNKYYLKFLNLDLHLFSYVAKENTLYKLNEDDEITIVKPDLLIELLNDQHVNVDINISDIFNPSDFLVSPFNSTEKFISNEYFLTVEQDNYKKQIIKYISSDEKFITVKGQPGSGKTLLIYDIAKYFSDSKNVKILHCANLNFGQTKLNKEYNWNIFPIKYYNNVLNDDLELLIIDECQRIKPNQLIKIIEFCSKKNIPIIFSYDERQVLNQDEKKRNIPNIIESKYNPKICNLNSKVRTNKEITAFIKSLFDKNRLIENYKYDDVEILFLKSMEEAKAFMSSKITGDWTIINYTPSLYYTYNYETYFTKITNTTTHDIIGQEFDRIICVIDSDFIYNDSGALLYSKRCHYNPSMMLYQNMTRARNQLKIIIINNSDILERCLQIVNISKKDKN